MVLSLLDTTLLPNLRSWFIQNNDTGDVLQGQFEPIEGSLTKDIVANYAEHTTLNRQRPILQFLNGSADVVTFQARLFNLSSFDTPADEQLEKLERWTKRDDNLGRPPIVTFWVGDKQFEMGSAVITGLTGITFGSPTFLGGLRTVTLSISLMQFEAFKLESKGLLGSLLSLVGFTRFHRARVRDYYELLTQREYGRPNFGDVIRKRHPEKATIQTGDVIALPNFQAIRKEKTQQTSVPLRTAFGRKDTPQRQLRLDIFDRRNIPFISHTAVG